MGHIRDLHPKYRVIGVDKCLKQCPPCRIHIRAFSYLDKYQKLEECVKNFNKKLKMTLEEERDVASECKFIEKGREFEKVEVFNYLGKPVTPDNEDWTAIMRNLKSKYPLGEDI